MSSPPMTARRVGAHLLVLGCFVLISAAWSYPAVLLDPTRLPGRHFDLLPALWLADQAPHVGVDLFHATSAWPEGETLARLDSWVFLALSWLLRPLLSATTIVGLVAWLGPALTAFAAERCAALAFGVSRPWSLVAGLATGFSGVMASAALEGQVPHLLEPWLPLLLGAAWLASGPGSRLRHGLWAGLGASLALLTTAYHGLVAVVVLVGLGLRALTHGWRAVVHLCAALLVLLPVTAWLALTYRAGDGDAVPPRRIVDLARLGSASLDSLLTWTPALDVAGHSVGAPTSALVAAALLLGWRTRGARWLLALAAVGLLLALGPVWRVGWDSTGVTSPLSFLWLPPLGAVLRFPVRFAWLTSMCGGVAVALVLHRARPVGRARAAMLGVALMDVFVVTGMPGRQGEIALPPAAGERDGAVLDLFGLAAWPEQSDVEMWARNRSCARQVVHRRPILERCIGTSVSSPRVRVAGWLLPRLMRPQGPPADTVRRLAALGVGNVVVHRDWFRPEDLPVLEAALVEMLGPPVFANGELVTHRVPGPETDRGRARRALETMRGRR
ncbi:MAG: hypothetical protein D6798_00355 [Deltaproteobacteria bacterium]|nr:MAG: hypothetical protein D6798_00355 [Deltaproteobacteria bacterium]